MFHWMLLWQTLTHLGDFVPAASSVTHRLQPLFLLCSPRRVGPPLLLAASLGSAGNSIRALLEGRRDRSSHGYCRVGLRGRTTFARG